MTDAVAALPWLTLIVWALAAFRVTRLIVWDEVLGELPAADENGDPIPGERGTGLRRLWDIALYDQTGESRNWLYGWLGKMTTCTWCTGVYASLAVVAAWETDIEWLRWPVLLAAVAGAQGYMNSRPGA